MGLAGIACRLTVLASLACSGEEVAAKAAGDVSLTGTWRAVEFTNPRADDSAGRYPLGRTPRAYLVYDATGHVFFQSVHGLAENKEARSRWRAADSASLRQLLADMSAFFGTYRVDYNRAVVIHSLEGEIPPSSVITEVATPFRIRGDTLVIGGDSTAHWIFRRVR